MLSFQEGETVIKNKYELWTAVSFYVIQAIS